MDIGRIGVWLGSLSLLAADDEREAARELERLGYGALWFGEGVGTRESFTQAATLLAWTSRIIIATGISSIYARDPMAMANGAKTLADAYPERFLLGIGVSHAPSVAERGHNYAPPIKTMRTYLDAIDAAVYLAAAPTRPPLRVVAALGARMLERAATRTWGAHPYFVPVEHTAFARKTLGRGPLLAPEQGFLLCTDVEEGRAAARAHTSHYLALDHYRNNLLRLGFSEDDVTGSGSDRLVDAIVACGDVEAVTDRVKAHLKAGADHVCVQALGTDPLKELRTIAPSLLKL
jgi:probable F420-dependent oxidoreductase